jgi:hypothetical protein
MAIKTEWNREYLCGCIEKATELLTNAGADGPALELLRNAAEHLECRDKYSCKAYRASLAKAIAELRRERKTEEEHQSLGALGSRNGRDSAASDSRMQA